VTAPSPGQPDDGGSGPAPVPTGLVADARLPEPTWVQQGRAHVLKRVIGRLWRWVR
jgi:hypothetical protein